MKKKFCCSNRRQWRGFYCRCKPWYGREACNKRFFLSGKRLEAYRIERQACRFAEDDAVKLHEMCEKLKEENEALKKEKSLAWGRAEKFHDENVDAAVLMIRYDELLQKLNELNEKMKGWLKL